MLATVGAKWAVWTISCGFDDVLQICYYTGYRYSVNNATTTGKKLLMRLIICTYVNNRGMHDVFIQSRKVDKLGKGDNCSTNNDSTALLQTQIMSKI